MEQEQNTTSNTNTEETVQSTSSSIAETPKKDNKKTTGVLALIIVIILGIGAYVYKTQTNYEGVVAVVNGEKLYKDELDQNTERIMQIARLQGQNVETPEAKASIANMSKNVMIDNMILIDAAEEAGHSVSDDEIEARYQEEVARYESEDIFIEQLSTINLSVEELKENIHDELLVKKYFDAVIEEENIVVLQDEIVARYDAYVNANPDNEELQTLEELQNDIEKVISVEKEQAFIEDLVQELKEEAKVEEII